MIFRVIFEQRPNGFSIFRRRSEGMNSLPTNFGEWEGCRKNFGILFIFPSKIGYFLIYFFFLDPRNSHLMGDGEWGLATFARTGDPVATLIQAHKIFIFNRDFFVSTD